MGNSNSGTYPELPCAEDCCELYTNKVYSEYLNMSPSEYASFLNLYIGIYDKEPSHLLCDHHMKIRCCIICALSGNIVTKVSCYGKYSFEYTVEIHNSEFPVCVQHFRDFKCKTCCLYFRYEAFNSECKHCTLTTEYKLKKLKLKEKQKQINLKNYCNLPNCYNAPISYNNLCKPHAKNLKKNIII